MAEAIEGETLAVKVTAGTASPQGMNGFPGDRWSGKSQLWWTGGKPGDKLTTELTTDKRLESLELVLTCARDYGGSRFRSDDKPLAEAIDLYEEQVVTTGVLSFKTPALAAGKHTLTIEILGANAKAAKSYMVGIDLIRFRAEGAAAPEVSDGVQATDAKGRKLNLDLSRARWRDWTADRRCFRRATDSRAILCRRGEVICAVDIMASFGSVVSRRQVTKGPER